MPVLVAFTYVYICRDGLNQINKGLHALFQYYNCLQNNIIDLSHNCLLLTLISGACE